MDTLSDKVILEVFAQGDSPKRDRVIKRMYVEYFPGISYFIRQNTGTEADAADIFQDALVVFYQKSRRKDFQISCTVKTYLYSICKNLWLHRLRSRKKEVRMPEDFKTIPIEADTLRVLMEEDHKKVIAELLGQLGDKCQSILRLFYFDRFKMEEIAQRLEISSAQVVRNQKAACMKKLRALIDKSSLFKNSLR